MATAIAPIMALEIHQEAKEVRSRRPAIQRIRYRQHVREMEGALSPEGSRTKPKADIRRHERASMLLVAEIRIAGGSPERAVVRNISAIGLMVEAETRRGEGETVSVLLGGLDWINATVVWKIGNRFGVRFDEPIDPGRVRRPIRSLVRSHEPATTARRIF